MKNIILLVILLGMFFPTSSYSATTTDGLITLDFYEDTQSDIENRWVLDFTINDVGGGIQSLTFDMTFVNTAMDYNNQYNTNTAYYLISYMVQSPGSFLPRISSRPPDYAPTPIDTIFTFYATPQSSGIPILGEFYVETYYYDNLGSDYHETLTLAGPIGFAPVPEPISTVLFAFGAFILKRFLKNK